MAEIPDDQQLSRVTLNARFGTSLLRHAVGCSSQYTLEFRQLAAEILRLRADRDRLRSLVTKYRRLAPSHGVQEWDELLGALAGVLFENIPENADRPPLETDR